MDGISLACPRCGRRCRLDEEAHDWECWNCGRRWEPASIDLVGNGETVLLGGPANTIRLLTVEPEAEPEPAEEPQRDGAEIDWSDREQAVTTREAAILLRLKLHSVRTLIRRRRLHAEMIDGRWFVSAADVDRLLSARPRRGRPKTGGGRIFHARNHGEVDTVSS